MTEQGRSPNNGSDERVAGERTPLHFTIGTGLRLGTDDELSLEVELRLVKVALLYADKARLFSPGASALMELHGTENLETPEERKRWLTEYFVKRVLTDPNGEVARRLQSSGRLARSPIIGRSARSMSPSR